MSFFKHPLFLAVLVIGGLYTIFAYVLNPPVPQSLLIQYMVICTVAVLLVVTFDNKTTTQFFAPLLSLFGSPGCCCPASLRLALWSPVLAI